MPKSNKPKKAAKKKATQKKLTADRIRELIMPHEQALIRNVNKDIPGANVKKILLRSKNPAQIHIRHFNKAIQAIPGMENYEFDGFDRSGQTYDKFNGQGQVWCNPDGTGWKWVDPEDCPGFGGN